MCEQIEFRKERFKVMSRGIFETRSLHSAEENCNKPSHYARFTVEPKIKTSVLRPGENPGIAHAAVYKILGGLQVILHTRHGVAELDDVPVPIFPVIEKGEVFPNPF